MKTVMTRPDLTVLTDPIPYGRYKISGPVKSLLRHIKRIVRPLPTYYDARYRGHFAVTRSLVEGLQKLGVNANYNPKKLNEVGEAVIVLCGIPALRQMIKLKKKGYIKTLLAGPNILVFPSSHNGIIASPEIDKCITPCEWTNNMYEKDCPSLKGRCIAWPVGVDTSYWCPNEKNERNTILIYEKTVKGLIPSIKLYIEYLHSLRYQTKVIQYGKYTPSDFLEALQKAVLMIGFTRGESQGIAWAETWSANVPTLIWRNTKNTFQKIEFTCSTAPYLTAETGNFFNDFEDFKKVFAKWELSKDHLKPREWALKNMSDEVCAKALCKIAGINV